MDGKTTARTSGSRSFTRLFSNTGGAGLLPRYFFNQMMPIARITPHLILVTLSLSIPACGTVPPWNMDHPVVWKSNRTSPSFDGSLHIIACNVERGYFRNDFAQYVTKMTKEAGAPVLLLSELDRNHSRTGDVFVAKELAESLDMHMVYVPEFVEYNDKTPNPVGDIGNAILSPYPLADISVIRHYTAHSWAMFGWIQNQRRYGDRVSIGATVNLPSGQKVRVYSLHLESISESLGRWIQIQEVLADMEKYKLPIAMGGDLNESPGGLMFTLLAKHGLKNAFEGDSTPTAPCIADDGKVKAFLKLDWILYHKLELVKSGVDYPTNRRGVPISDHAPVRALFRMTQ